MLESQKGARLLLALLSLFACSTWGCGAEAEASSTHEPRQFVIGLSSSSCAPREGASQHVEVVLRYLLAGVPNGSSVKVLDTSTGATVATLDIPNRAAFSHLKVREREFGSQLRAVLERFSGVSPSAACAGPACSCGMRLPLVMDRIALFAQGSKLPTSALIVGSLLSSEASGSPEQTMQNGYYPSDGHLAASPGSSPFTIVGKREQLAGTTIHLVDMASSYRTSRHEAAIKRFWGMFVSGQGGNLVTLIDDIDIAIRRLGDPALPNLRTDEPRTADGQLEMRSADAVTDNLWAPTPGHSPPPQSHVGPLKLGISWSEMGCDLDLYLRPRSNSPELSYRRPATADGGFFKDFSTAPNPVNGYEWAVIKEPIDVYAVEAAVNMYAGDCPAGARGEVRAYFEGKVYAKEFFIASERGTRGGANGGRANDKAWVVLDIPELIGLERRPLAPPRASRR